MNQKKNIRRALADQRAKSLQDAFLFWRFEAKCNSKYSVEDGIGSA